MPRTSLATARRVFPLAARAARIGSALTLAALLAACGGAGDDARATAEGLRRITINYPTVSAASWPLFAAREGGYFEKYGLDATLVFGVHPAGLAMITSGEAVMTNYSMEQALQAASRDGSFLMVGSSLNKGTFALMASPEIENIAGLRGKRFGVSQIGDAPYNYTVALLGKFGLTSRDVQWIPVGSGASGRAAALAGNRVDATLLTPPSFFRLEDEGFRNLANFADYDDIYASTVYMLSRSQVERWPELPRLLIQAQAEAIQRIYNDRDFSVQAYLVYDPGQTREDVNRIYDRYTEPNSFERIPYVLDGAVRSVIQQADTVNSPQMTTFDFTRVIDNGYIDQLVAEGFFVELFGGEIAAEQARKAELAFGP